MPISAQKQKLKNWSKSMVLAIRKFSKYFIARAGWLFGGARPTFVDQFFEALQNRTARSYLRPMAHSDVDKIFLSGSFKMFETNPSGIYHLSSEFVRGSYDSPSGIRDCKISREKPSHRLPLARAWDFKVPRAPSNVLINTKLPHLLTGVIKFKSTFFLRLQNQQNK